ncbi:Protein SPIRAL1-like 4 [Cardamine amara subsp. amara]|uniref:Protein SPIRAL1-like 4 n=1 Tax=Cardamine amara subsp. amara TaxID=228776 RepID=A0ABD1AGK7_CARAN
MGKARGLNSGGGESSLGYLFGSGESVCKPKKPAVNTSFATTTTTTTTTDGAGGRPMTTTITTTTGDKNKTEEEKKKQCSAGVRGSPNNYYRSDGQNCGNFLTERPSTKVHAAPGGGSSLGYLFGSGPSGSQK